MNYGHFSPKKMLHGLGGSHSRATALERRFPIRIYRNGVKLWKGLPRFHGTKPHTPQGSKPQAKIAAIILCITGSTYIRREIFLIDGKRDIHIISFFNWFKKEAREDRRNQTQYLIATAWGGEAGVLTLINASSLRPSHINHSYFFFSLLLS